MTYTPEELREADDEIGAEYPATNVHSTTLIISLTDKLIQDRIRAKRAEGKLARARGLLREVINYRKGNGKYDFSRVPSEERQNYVLDAWIDLELEITAALKELEEK